MMKGNFTVSHAFRLCEVTGFYQQLKSFWSCSHMNCCLQYILHINLHILFVIQVKTSQKIQESRKSNKYLKSYQINKIDDFVQSCVQIAFHLNFKFRPGFQVNPLCESCAKVNPHVIVIEFLSASHHVMLCQLIS